MPRRSVLFSPGDRPSLLRKAPGSGADSVVFDLEDGVAPGDKEAGRRAVRTVVTDEAFDPDCEVCVRVSREHAPTDLDVVLRGVGAAETGISAAGTADARIDAVVLPKAESAADVEWLDDLLRERDADLPILALCETAAGVLHAEAVAAADATDAVLFGAEDLSADIGANRSEDGVEVLAAREHVVLAASAARVDAIDTVFTAIEETDRLADETAFARDLGFDGKMAIHPAQVPVINDAFTPTDEQVAWARRVVDAAAEHDVGVFRVDDQMIDAPLIRRAERVLERDGDHDGER